MKSYTFSYGAGEWDAIIDVELTDEEAAILEANMPEGSESFLYRMDDEPAVLDICRKIDDEIFKANKKMMIEDGRLEELREFNPDADDDELILEELGNYHICFPKVEGK